MWKWLLCAFLASASAPAFAQNATAYEALRTIGKTLNRDAVNHIIMMTATGGDPQPRTWKILLEDSRAQGGLREVEIENGRIASERTPVRVYLGNNSATIINTARLNLDSSGAYGVARHTAEKSNANFSTVSYTLRADERGTPVWILRLESASGAPVGTVFVGAERGTVTRTEGLFGGNTMNAAIDSSDDQESPSRGVDPEESGDGIKARFKRAFRETRDDAKRTFHSVSRSFRQFVDDNFD